MFVAIEVLEYYFALPLTMVERVVDTNSLQITEEVASFQGKEVPFVHIEELLSLRSDKREDKSLAILLKDREEPAFILVKAVRGLLEREKLECAPINEVLRRYGFELVSAICRYGDRLIFLLDEKALAKRLEELILWR